MVAAPVYAPSLAPLLLPLLLSHDLPLPVFTSGLRDGHTRPHSPRLVVSCCTCPPLSPSPHANSFIIGTAVINTHTFEVRIRKSDLRIAPHGVMFGRCLTIFVTGN